MDATPVLASIASLLPSLPDQSVEDQLVTFDTLVNVSDPARRSHAAELLRAAATSSADPSRRDRLLRAADAVATGRPSALTPEGLSAAQAAASQTMTREQWEKHAAENPLPPPPSNEEEETLEDEEAQEDDEEEKDRRMETEPPKLPHLPVRHFFPGLVIRVAQAFADAQGRAVSAGDLFHVLTCERIDGGAYVLNLLVRSIRLDPGSKAIIENTANAWFQPVPSIDCLYELWQAIDVALTDAADEAEDDGDEDDRMEALSADVEACHAWLTQSGRRSGQRGPAPECRSGPLASRVFGRDHHLTAWIPLLFAGVAVALPESQ